MGICAAVALSGVICHALTDNVEVVQVGYVAPRSGFSNFVGSSSAATVIVPMKKAQTLLDAYIKQLNRLVPRSLSQHSDDLYESLQEIKDFEAYEYGSSERTATTVIYDKGAGKLSFYMHTFRPLNQTHIQASNFNVVAKVVIPTDFLIVDTIKSNALRSKVTTRLEEVPRNLDSQAVIDAISMALAPGIEGYIELPDAMISRLKLEAKSSSAKIQSSFA